VPAGVLVMAEFFVKSNEHGGVTYAWQVRLNNQAGDSKVIAGGIFCDGLLISAVVCEWDEIANKPTALLTFSDSSQTRIYGAEVIQEAIGNFCAKKSRAIKQTDAVFNNPACRYGHIG
jgi:hypothetical protein